MKKEKIMLILYLYFTCMGKAKTITFPLYVKEHSNVFNSIDEAVQALWEERYFTYITVGFPSKSYPLALDTSSNWIGLLGANCKQCKGAERYDENQSVTSEETSDEMAQWEREKVMVKRFKDVVWEVYDELEFIVVQSMVKASSEWKEMGMLGINKLACNGITGSSLIEKMYNHGLIDKKAIGIWISGNYSLFDDRVMHIGNITDVYFNQSMKSFTTTDWVLSLQAIHFSKYEFIYESDFAVLDYLHYFTLTSKHNFNKFTDGIKNHFRFLKIFEHNGNTFAYTFCKSDYSDLLMTLNGITYRLPVYHYLVSIYVNGTKFCLLAVAGTDDKSEHLWSLGTHFLKNYYVVLNPVNQTVTFAQ
eukprot:TRINITY_DN6050_c0_g1_i2.p1 TRINITY_DN6050_c0_g1~~TRINITY_DN6050_c0_g1_i2.p1  ORF type:complete len:361 (-),score=33.82 TRINITY_DN6050_c0_g1_i2:231-1313(-)